MSGGIEQRFHKAMYLVHPLWWLCVQQPAPAFNDCSSQVSWVFQMTPSDSEVGRGDAFLLLSLFPHRRSEPIHPTWNRDSGSRLQVRLMASQAGTGNPCGCVRWGGETTEEWDGWVGGMEMKIGVTQNSLQRL